MVESEINLIVQNPAVMTSNNPHLLPDFNADAVEDDDFGNFLDEDEMEDNTAKEAVPSQEVKKEEESSDEDEDDDSVSSLQKISSKSGSGAVIKRNASWVSFVHRSERNHLEGKEKPPTADEVRSRKVHFVEEDKLEIVHEVDQVAPEDKYNYWMSGEDFDRLDNEVKLVRFRWENHKTGKIKMDEKTTSIRGLEHMLKDPELKKKRGVQPWQHTRCVLEEIHRQKTDNKEIDWEKVRAESLRSSSVGVEYGYVTGKADEEDRVRAWDPTAVAVTATKESKNDGKKKKKGFFSSMFGGKK